MKKCFLLLIVLAIYLSACKKDEIVGVGDLSVTITSNSSGNPLLKGATVFTVPATKERITDDKGSVILKDLPAGTYKVYATLEGFGSATGSALINKGSVAQITMNANEGVKLGFMPTITIQTPNDHDKYTQYDIIAFSIQVSDDITPLQNLKVELSSDLDGKLFETYPDNSGNIKYQTSSLSAGNHIIRATVTDKDNYTTTKSINISTLLPGNVILENATVNGGNVQLLWQKYLLKDLGSIEIYRAADQNAGGQLIKTFKTADTISFIDTRPPFLNDVYYYVRVVNKYGEIRNSNRLKVNVPYGKIYNFSPDDAIHHPSKQIVYLVDNIAHKLRVIDYTTNTEIDNVLFSGTAGKIDIADNGFGLEVYVPSSNGNIYCYDANTLTLNASIVTNFTPYSVTTNGNGYLVAGLSVTDRSIRTYSRKSGINMDCFGYDSADILRFIPNTNNIVSISLNASSTQKYYFELSSTGMFLHNTKVMIGFNNYVDPKIFRMSPNGQYLIAGQTAYVYLTTSTLPCQGAIVSGTMLYSDFAFSPDGNTIYAGTSNKASIQVVKYPVLTSTTEIVTRGYPKFVFYYNGEVVSVSLGSIGSSSFEIERIKVI